MYCEVVVKIRGAFHMFDGVPKVFAARQRMVW